MTGYHAWVFSFMALVFHFPLVVVGGLSFALECRCLGSLMMFWIAEDFLWFVLNPGFSAKQLFRGEIPWHKRMFLCLPVDYWVFGLASGILIALSYR